MANLADKDFLADIKHHIDYMSNQLRWRIIYALEAIGEDTPFMINKANDRVLKGLIELLRTNMPDKPKGS